jgi:hypothetical protein
LQKNISKKYSVGSVSSKCKKLKSKSNLIEAEAENPVGNNVLLSVTVSRKKDEIVYSVDRSNDLTNEELEYYLKEIIGGICKWKPGICEETVQTFKGTIKKGKKTSNPK